MAKTSPQKDLVELLNLGYEMEQKGAQEEKDFKNLSIIAISDNKIDSINDDKMHMLASKKAENLENCSNSSEYA